MSSSLSTDRVFNYDVFLSFRGPDIRKTAASHLYDALVNRGIRTFQDDREIKLGDSIREKLRGAIESSRFALVIISKTYATSRWCLEELQLIMELVEKKQIGLIPVFYDVIPSEVKNLRGKFDLKGGRNPEMVKNIPKWRQSLKIFGDQKGIESSKCKSDAMMVGEIAGCISSRLFSMFPMDLEDIEGMEDHMERLKPLLDMDSKNSDVRMIGIWGMGGIGKTPIAKYLYERYKHLFSSHHCFIEEVSSSSKENGIVSLQKQLLSSVLDGEDNLKFWNPDAGANHIKSRLRNLKALIVLDDVDDAKQLDRLAREHSWFGPGSRIIIVTQDKSLLKSTDHVYKVKYMDDDKALQLFQRIAFLGEKTPSRYKHLSSLFSKLAQGLPLALQTFGIHLRDKTPGQWQVALKSFQETPNEKIMNVLKISYDRLEELEKAAFLHVACFFNGEDFLRVTKFFEQGDVVIRDLARKSLIDISSNGRISMHRLLEQTGRKIVRQESTHGPGHQRILWHHDDIYHVLVDKAGTTKIEGVAACDISKRTEDFHINWDFFERMHNLRFLKIYKHSRGIEARREDLTQRKSLCVPRKLKLLHWDAYPFPTLPTGINQDFLVELTMCYSKLITLWSKTEIPKLLHLRKLVLKGSKDLKELPNLEKAEFLEELILEGCASLKQIPKFICNLPSLQKLDVSNCDGLNEPRIRVTESNSSIIQDRRLDVRSVRLQLYGTIPSEEESQDISLTNLLIKGNLKIELMPLRGFAEHLSYVSEKHISHELLDHDEPPYGCKSLDIMRFDCNNKSGYFKCRNFSGFPWLLELNLINLNIQKIPDDIQNMRVLERLDLSGNVFVLLPTTMNGLTKLKHLTLCNCRSLKELPELYQVERLTLSDCTNLRRVVKIGQASYNLLELWLDNCKSIVSLSDELSHITELRYLDLSRQDFQTVPTNITKLTSLVTLCLNYCNNLVSLEGLPPSLKYLDAHGCNSLEASSLLVTHSFDLSPCPQWRQDTSHITRFPAGRRGKEVPVCACFQETTIASTYNQVTCSSLISNHLRHLKSWLGAFARCVSVPGLVILLVVLAILLVCFVIMLVTGMDSFTATLL